MSDLRGNSVPVKVNMGSTTKSVGALIIAAAVAGIGVYIYETGMWKMPPHQAQVVANNQLPSPTPPGQPQ